MEPRFVLSCVPHTDNTLSSIDEDIYNSLAKVEICCNLCLEGSPLANVWALPTILPCGAPLWRIWLVGTRLLRDWKGAEWDAMHLQAWDAMLLCELASLPSCFRYCSMYIPVHVRRIAHIVLQAAKAELGYYSSD